MSCRLAEHVPLSPAGSDDVLAEFFPQPLDVDLDDVAVLVSVLFVNVLGKLCLGEDATGMQHAVAQQPELDTGQVPALPVPADRLGP